MTVKKKASLVAVVCVLVLNVAAEMRIRVSADLSTKNLLEGENADFEQGLAGWSNRHSNAVFCVESPGHGLALHCPADRKFVNRYVDMKRFRKGCSYVLSCDIKPSRDISTARVGDGKSGLGCSISFWDKERKKCELVSCRAEGPN